MISSGVLVAALVVLAALLIFAVGLMVVHGTAGAAAGRVRERRVGRARQALLVAARTGHADPESTAALAAVSRDQALALLDELGRALPGRSARRWPRSPACAG